MSINPVCKINTDPNILITSDPSSHLKFSILENKSSSFSFVQKFLASKNIPQVLENKDFSNKVLLNKGTLVGIISYLPDLVEDKMRKYGTHKNLLVKIVSLLDVNPTPFFCDKLISEIKAIANRRLAEGIVLEHWEDYLIKPLHENGFSFEKSEGHFQIAHLNLLSQKKDKNKAYTQNNMEKIELPLTTHNILEEKKKLLKRKGENESNLSLKQASRGKKTYENELKEETKEEIKLDMPPTKQHVRTHSLPMKGAIYMEYIMQGKKLFEGRIFGPSCKKMAVGDCLKLFDRAANWGILCQIQSLDVYDSFEAMLKEKGALNMLPQLSKFSERLSKEELINEGVKIYKAFPGSSRVSKDGAVAIGVKFIQKI